MIFDLDMGFARMELFLEGISNTDPPASATYESVVLMDSIRILLLIAALNGVDILSADIKCAYLNYQCKEKVWFRYRS